MRTFTRGDESYRVLCDLVAAPDPIDVDCVCAMETDRGEVRSARKGRRATPTQAPVADGTSPWVSQAAMVR